MLYFKDRGEGPHLKLLYQYKYGTIYDYLRRKSQLYWLPGSRITVDEIMIRFEGRSSGIITIPGKPVPIGFKYFTLADEGYIQNFEYTALGTLEGEIDEDITSRVITLLGTIETIKLSNT